MDLAREEQVYSSSDSCEVSPPVGWNSPDRPRDNTYPSLSTPSSEYDYVEQESSLKIYGNAADDGKDIDGQICIN